MERASLSAPLSRNNTADESAITARDDVSAKLQQRPSAPTINAPAPPTPQTPLESSEESPAFIAFVHPFRERVDIVQPLAWSVKRNNSPYNP